MYIRTKPHLSQHDGRLAKQDGKTAQPQNQPSNGMNPGAICHHHRLAHAHGGQMVGLVLVWTPSKLVCNSLPLPVGCALNSNGNIEEELGGLFWVKATCHAKSTTGGDGVM